MRVREREREVVCVRECVRVCVCVCMCVCTHATVIMYVLVGTVCAAVNGQIINVCNFDNALLLYFYLLSTKCRIYVSQGTQYRVEEVVWCVRACMRGGQQRDSPMLVCFSRRQMRASLSSFWWSVGTRRENRNHGYEDEPAKQEQISRVLYMREAWDS